LLGSLVVLRRTVGHHPLVLLHLLHAAGSILGKFLLGDDLLHLVENSLRFLNERWGTLAPLVSACASVSMLLTVYSIAENLPVRLSLLVDVKEEPETIEDPVLLKMDDCIWAYRVLLISSKLLIIYETNNK
jgi:hypothetical protein